MEASAVLAAPPPADVLLADGSVAVIRPLRPEDLAELVALHETASDESIRLRFFALSRRAGAAYIRRLSEQPADAAAALVAVKRGRLVGLATAELEDTDTAEVAFFVADAEHGHGLGSLLLEHLAAVARGRGITTFVAEVLAENRAMLRVLRDAGFAETHRNDEGVVHVEMDVTARPEAVAAADLREFQAEARSLHPLLYPRSVAVVGAGGKPGGIGRGILDAIAAGGFTGAVYAVHPRLDRVNGVPAFTSVAGVPEHVDLVVIAVPPRQVAEVLADAAQAGVSSAVVVTSGFGELGGTGAAEQQRLVRVARENSIRLVGPNCLGVMCNDPAIRLNATFARRLPGPGGLAVASQSGGFGIVLLDLAEAAHLGVHSFVSLGNKADVSGNDLLSAWMADPKVTSAALYLESFGNAPKFARIARRFSTHKPVLAVLGGRSTGGRRGGGSHTAAAATPSRGVEALFNHAGVISCDTAEEMTDTALLLTRQPLPTGRRVAVLSNAGGLGVLAADQADRAGLVVPTLSEPLQDRVSEWVSGTVGVSNPIDLGAVCTPMALRNGLELVLGSGEVDAALVLLAATRLNDPAALLAAVSAGRRAAPERPVLLVGLGPLGPSSRPEGVAAYPSVAGAVQALAHATWYAQWRSVPHDDPPPADPGRARAVARAAADLLGTATDGLGWLPRGDAARLLAPYGVHPVGEVASGADAAARLAERLGFPVAVKVADHRVVHKAERRLVRVGLHTADDVRGAVHDFARELGHDDTVLVIVQPVVRGVELALGIVRDQVFGPLAMVAAGGTALDVWNDRTFLIPPLTRNDAERALRSLRIWPLLDGYRGSPRVDLDAVQDLLVGIGQLAVDAPQVADLDLNPVVATPDGARCVDVKLRLADTPVLDAGIPRRLRDIR